MIEIFIILSIVAIIMIIAALSYRMDHSTRDAIEEESEDDILLGAYYGDPRTKTCVHVISVEDGVVAFQFVDEKHWGESYSLPRDAFAHTYQKFPDGCPFTQTF